MTLGQMWVAFSCLLLVGALCKVGVYMVQFLLGATSASIATLFGLGEYGQLQTFLAVSFICILVARLNHREAKNSF